jgi:hypothetical protein
MTPIADRPLLPLLAILLATLVPVFYHAFGDANRDDCADPAGLLAAYRIEGTQEESERWDKHIKDWIQWTEGEINATRSDVEPLSFRIIRTFRGRRVYLRPTIFLPERLEPDHIEVRWIDVDGERVPISIGTVFQHSKRSMKLAAYLFAYEDKPVIHPFREHLASALPQVFGGTRPLTLFLVSGYAKQDQIESIERPALEWLANAWRHYRDSCLE